MALDFQLFPDLSSGYRHTGAEHDVKHPSEHKDSVSSDLNNLK